MLKKDLEKIKFEKVIMDFKDVFCFRKVDSEEHFNFKVYDKLVRKNLVSVLIGKKNYAYLRTWHFEKLTNQIVDKKKLLEIEYELDKIMMYLNPFILQYIYKSSEVYIHNNTNYSNEKVLEITRKFVDNSFLRKIKIINSIEMLQNDYSTLYITTQDRVKVNIQTIRYDLSLKNEIDLESMLYKEYDQRFYKLRKAISIEKRCENEYFKIGSLYLGPLLLSFVKLVIEDLHKKNISLVLPLMREGELLHKVIELFKKQRENNITSKKLYVSRKSTYIPSLYKEISAEDIWIFFEGINLSVQDLYNIFNVRVIDTKEKRNNLYTVKRNHKEEYLKIKNDFISKIKYLNLSECVYKKREILQSYIHQVVKGHENERIATIDIGFKGTIQENLERISDNYKYEHYLLFGREGLLKKIISGIHLNSYINSNDYDFVKDILRATHAFEQIIMGIEGSTLDYVVLENRIYPKKENLKYSEEEIIARRKIHEGVCYFIDLALQLHLDDDIQLKDLINSSKILHRLLNFPTKMEALSIGKLHYSINFGSMEFKSIINEQEIDQYNVQDVYTAIKGSELSSNIIWPQGVLALKDPSYVYKNLIETDLKDIFSKIKFILEISEGSDIVIYGAGEVANKVYRTLNIRSLKPLYFVDKNPKLHHTKIEGIKIIGPNELVDITVKYIIIASYTFAEEIEKDLMELYQDKEIHPILVRID